MMGRAMSTPLDIGGSLSGVRLFVGLERPALGAVTAAAERIRKERDGMFFQQGEEALRLYVLRAGQVKLSQVSPEGHQMVVRYAGAGELFGCVPLFGGSEYPATATAVTACEALAWDRPAMDALMQRHPQIALNALVLVGEELEEIRSRYRELATQRVERRIASALLRLLRQAGKRIESGVLIEFPLSRQDLAELTGTTLHTTSRILSGWESRGLIESSRQRIVIREPRRLLVIAEDLES